MLVLPEQGDHDCALQALSLSHCRLYPLLLHCMSLANTGMLGFSLLSLCLLLCVISTITPGSPFILYTNTLNTDTSISVIILLVGIISSRSGLWIADLSVHQVFQQEIQEHLRGTVSGVQSGLQVLSFEGKCSHEKPVSEWHGTVEVLSHHCFASSKHVWIFNHPFIHRKLKNFSINI